MSGRTHTRPAPAGMNNPTFHRVPLLFSSPQIRSPLFDQRPSFLSQQAFDKNRAFWAIFFFQFFVRQLYSKILVLPLALIYLSCSQLSFMFLSIFHVSISLLCCVLSLMFLSIFKFSIFSRVLCDSTPRYVGQSVGPLFSCGHATL